MIVLLNRVNAFTDSKHRNQWCAHREGCMDIAREQRTSGVHVEATIADLPAYMDEVYGVDAGYDSPWTVEDVTIHPCVKSRS